MPCAGPVATTACHAQQPILHTKKKNIYRKKVKNTYTAHKHTITHTHTYLRRSSQEHDSRSQDWQGFDTHTHTHKLNEGRRVLVRRCPKWARCAAPRTPAVRRGSEIPFDRVATGPSLRWAVATAWDVLVSEASKSIIEIPQNDTHHHHHPKQLRRNYTWICSFRLPTGKMSHAQTCIPGSVPESTATIYKRD